MATTIGTIQLIAKIDTSQYKKGASEIERTNDKLEGSSERTSKRGIGAFSNMAKLGLGLVTAAAVAAGAAIIKNIGNAVRRVDTLNNFPKVMANLGYGADEANKAIETLDKGVQGLPTSLDSIASAMQNISPATSSLDEATNLTLALNNALLAGGKSADIQATGMEQFSQAIAKGKPDMMEWRTLATAMPGQLQQISKSLGYENWQKMAGAVSDGTLEFDKVKEAIVALNKDGLGELPSFAEQAKNATNGISTGIAQMNTAITRGIANFIQKIGSANINKALGGIGKAFEGFFNILSSNDYVLGAVAGTLGGVLLAAIWGLVTAVWALVPAIWAAAAPILPFVAAFAAIGAVAVLIYKNWSKIQPVIQPVVDVFKRLWEMLKPLRDFVANQFKAAWEDLKQAFESIKQTVAPFMPQLKILGGILLAFILAPFLLVVGGILLAIGVIVGIITVIARLIGWIAKAIAWWMKIGETVRKAIGRMASSVASGISSVINWFKRLPGKVASAVGNLGKTLYNKGRELIQGLQNGAASLLKSLGRWFLNKLPGFIRKPFEKAMGISSPSKVFAEYGKNIAQGLAGGVDKYSGLASKAINGLASDVSTTMNPSINYSVLDGTNSRGMSRKTEIVQNNTINNDVDMDKALSDLAWKVAN